jgi:phospholipid/cholesterol/gamma-HCH transport system substrate-binding protein
MEDRAKYVLVGLFTFAVIAGVFGFIYWLNATSSSKDSASYRVIFSGAVTGLRIGAPVLFNGIRVGEVSNLGLTDNPAEVAATLAVTPSTPIRADTVVTLDYAGLTGIASVSMKGNQASAPPLKAKKGEPLTLRAEAANGDMSTAVRETLAKADAVIAENKESLHNTIKNLETFSAALARNGEKLDKLMSSSTEAVTSFKELTGNLDTRTASITEGINTLTASATKHIDIVGNDAHRAIIHIDKAVTDLANHPQRFIFGGSSK